MKTLLLGYVILCIGVIYGYIVNLSIVIHSHFELAQMPLAMVVRIIGIFIPPLGGLMGWLS
jgi:hypothetical protein